MTSSCSNAYCLIVFLYCPFPCKSRQRDCGFESMIYCFRSRCLSICQSGRYTQSFFGCQVYHHGKAKGAVAISTPPKIGWHDYIRHKEIQAIQSAIKSTIRPTWQQAPLKGFGSSQQGKLKADQWRTMIKFDLPITLVELWSEGAKCNPHATKYYSALLDITILLALAVFWGTLWHTSAEHAAKYMYYMQMYLKSLQNLSPAPKLVPNHHTALHVGKQLLAFGPVYGWWAFPYEHLIGAL